MSSLIVDSVYSMFTSTKRKIVGSTSKVGIPISKDMAMRKRITKMAKKTNDLPFMFFRPSNMAEIKGDRGRARVPTKHLSVVCHQFTFRVQYVANEGPILGTIRVLAKRKSSQKGRKLNVAWKCLRAQNSILSSFVSKVLTWIQYSKR